MNLHARLDKNKLLLRVHTEYDFADRTLALVPATRMDEPGVCGHWSVKDLIAHLTSWEQRTLRWLDEAESGTKLTVPEAGFGWHEFDRLNDVYYQRNRQLSLDEIVADFHATRQTMLARIEQFSEAELAGGGKFAGLFIDSPADAIEGNTSHHYELHLAQIRGWLATG